MIEKWDKAYTSDIETEPSHIIARSKGIQPLKDICKYNIETCEKQQGIFELDNLQIEISDQELYHWKDYYKIKIGTGLYDKSQIYRVMEQIFNKKILLKDESRAIKKEHGMNYTLTIQKPTNGNYPLIIMHHPYNYIIAPCIEEN